MIGGGFPSVIVDTSFKQRGALNRPACCEELGVSSADEVLQPLGRATCWDNSFLGVEVELRLDPNTILKRKQKPGMFPKGDSGGCFSIYI